MLHDEVNCLRLSDAESFIIHINVLEDAKHFQIVNCIHINNVIINRNLIRDSHVGVVKEVIKSFGSRVNLTVTIDVIVEGIHEDEGDFFVHSFTFFIWL